MTEPPQWEWRQGRPLLHQTLAPPPALLLSVPAPTPTMSCPQTVGRGERRVRGAHARPRGPHLEHALRRPPPRQLRRRGCRPAVARRVAQARWAVLLGCMVAGAAGGVAAEAAVPSMLEVIAPLFPSPTPHLPCQQGGRVGGSGPELAQVRGAGRVPHGCGGRVGPAGCVVAGRRAVRPRGACGALPFSALPCRCVQLCSPGPIG